MLITIPPTVKHTATVIFLHVNSFVYLQAHSELEWKIGTR